LKAGYNTSQGVKIFRLKKIFLILTKSEFFFDQNKSRTRLNLQIKKKQQLRSLTFQPGWRSRKGPAFLISYH
jgi:hypothetical protein